MTKEEIQKRTSDKIKAIRTLVESLDIEIISRQMISKEGFIDNIIYYLDKEKYPVDIDIKKEKNDKK